MMRWSPPIFFFFLGYLVSHFCSQYIFERFVTIFIKFIGPLGSVLLNVWKVQAKEQQIYHLFLMICYDAVFFSQGVVDMCYYPKMLRSRAKWGQSCHTRMETNANERERTETNATQARRR